MASDVSFAGRLRAWRERRGLSQLALAGRAGVSQRHLSFLELGRSRPSRDMVDRLVVALGVPLRQHNELLLAAGFAPEWRQRDLASPDMSAVASALDYMLNQQEPYPAVVVDRHWNLLRGNEGAARLVEFLIGPATPGATANLADALVGPDALKPHLRNWPEIVRHFIRSIEADAVADGSPETAALLKRLLGYRGVRAALRQQSGSGEAGPVLPMHFQKDGDELRLFTTIATLGTPQDVTAAELRIECFFPMDAATGQLMRAWSQQGVRRARVAVPSLAGRR
jgi:transcriptional regulator with XRE-family HTH domain